MTAVIVPSKKKATYKLNSNIAYARSATCFHDSLELHALTTANECDYTPINAIH